MESRLCLRSIRLPVTRPLEETETWEDLKKVRDYLDSTSTQEDRHKFKRQLLLHTLSHLLI